MERIIITENIFSFIEQDIRAGMLIAFVCLVLVFAACTMDMWTGIDAARVNKEPIRSRPLRKTGIKIVDYYKFLFCVFLVDILGVCIDWFDKPYAIVIGTASVLIVEGKSVLENLKKKKSNAAEAADYAKKIVECLTKEEAEKLIRLIKDDKNNSYNKKRQRKLEYSSTIMPDEDPGYISTIDDSY